MSSFTPAPHDMLQRACACGKHTVAGGECEECRQKRETTLQRAAVNTSPANQIPRPEGETPQALGSLPNAREFSFAETLPWADFTQIPTRFRGAEGIQTKLTINQPGDQYEQEADRVANQVMARWSHSARNSAPPHIQRFVGHPTSQLEAAPASVDQALASSGRPLEPTLQQDMEQRFGHDFSQVRVHTNALAAQSARDVQAHAYTVGQNLVFGAGRYNPSTHEGQRLLAHELTHVVQQTVAPGIQADQGSDRLHLPTPVVVQTSDIAVMRAGFESTIKICHRVLVSRDFEVTKGGVRVVLLPTELDTEIPGCHEHKFRVTLTKSIAYWPDHEIATCEGETGGNRSFSFGNISSGTYYLTVHRDFDHPYCCIEGDILVFDEPISSDSSTCKRDKDPSALDIVHGALDIAGFIPILGAIPDGVNAGIYALEGDWPNAGLSAIAMVPAWGDGVKLGVIGSKSAVKITEKAAIRLGEEGIAKGLKEVKAASEVSHAARLEKEAAKEAETLAVKGGGEGAAKEAEKVAVGSSEKEAVRAGEKGTAEKEIAGEGFAEGPAKVSRPGPAPKTGFGKEARKEFDALRDGYAKRLGVSSGGQVHHAVELQVLDRYPGVYTRSELNAFENMRGIGTELQGKRQLHNSKVREIWDRHYARIDKEIAARGLRPGSKQYREYVRKFLQDGRDELDYVLGQFFTEYRTGRPRSFQ